MSSGLTIEGGGGVAAKQHRTRLRREPKEQGTEQRAEGAHQGSCPRRLLAVMHRRAALQHLRKRVTVRLAQDALAATQGGGGEAAHLALRAGQSPRGDWQLSAALPTDRPPRSLHCAAPEHGSAISSRCGEQYGTAILRLTSARRRDIRRSP